MNAPRPSGPAAMVVAPEPDAAAIGVDVLHAGGNAVDAAVAVALAQGVLDPLMTGLGGYGCMQVVAPDRGLHRSYGFLFEAPGAVRADMWADLLEYETRDGFGFVLRGRVNDVGHGSVAVPGALKGYAHAHRLHGRLPWSAVVEPAARAAAEGYVITPAIRDYWEEVENSGRVETIDRLRRCAGYADQFFGPDGGLHPVGTVVRNPDCARTLERIGREGADAFYEGPIAEAIATDMKAHGGLVSLQDLRSYRVDETPPVTAHYRDHTVAVCPPPGAGVVLLKMLKIAEHLDLTALGHNSPDYVRVMAEIIRRGHLLKDTGLSDPRARAVDVPALLDDAAARRDAEAILRGERCVVERACAPDPANTTHLCVVDGSGTMVTLTHSLAKQSGVVTPGLGFMYNGAMAMFDPRPGRPRSLAPGLRTVSSMSPAIVFRGVEPVLAIGAPGGAYIPGGIFQVLVNVLDFGMGLAEAVAAPRFGAPGNAIDLVARFPASVCRSLEAAGYATRRLPWSYMWPKVQVVARAPGGGRVSGASDPMGGGVALPA